MDIKEQLRSSFRELLGKAEEVKNVMNLQPGQQLGGRDIKDALKIEEPAEFIALYNRLAGFGFVREALDTRDINGRLRLYTDPVSLVKFFDEAIDKLDKQAATLRIMREIAGDPASYILDKPAGGGKIITL